MAEAMTDQRLEEITAILNEAPTLMYLYVPANELVLEVERLRAENRSFRDEIHRLSIQPVPYWCDLCDRRFPHAPEKKS